MIASKVTAIDVSENYLTQISELSQFKFPNLTSLNLSVNLLNSIEGFSGTKMPELGALFLCIFLHVM